MNISNQLRTLSVGKARPNAGRNSRRTARTQKDRIHGYLLLMAKRCGIENQNGCLRVLRHLTELPTESEALRQVLFPLRMTPAGFRVMVAFYASHPAHLTAAEVATQCDLPNATIAALIEQSASKLWIRGADPEAAGNMQRWMLTGGGMCMAAVAIYRYLEKLVELANASPRGGAE